VEGRRCATLDARYSGLYGRQGDHARGEAEEQPEQRRRLT
jgi:hypothetical protein